MILVGVTFSGHGRIRFGISFNNGSTLRYEKTREYFLVSIGRGAPNDQSNIFFSFFGLLEHSLDSEIGR